MGLVPAAWPEVTSLQKVRVFMESRNGSGWASDPKEIFIADLHLVVLRTNRGVRVGAGRGEEGNGEEHLSLFLS